MNSNFDHINMCCIVKFKLSMYGQFCLSSPNRRKTVSDSPQSLSIFGPLFDFKFERVIMASNNSLRKYVSNSSSQLQMKLIPANYKTKRFLKSAANSEWQASTLKVGNSILISNQNKNFCLDSRSPTGWNLEIVSYFHQMLSPVRIYFLKTTS